MIWYLLKPGTDVYVITFVGVVFDVAAITSHPNEQQWWQISIWRLRTDGATIRRTKKDYIINTYPGLRDVTELPVYPVSVWDAKDKGERRQKNTCEKQGFFQSPPAG